MAEAGTEAYQEKVSLVLGRVSAWGGDDNARDSRFSLPTQKAKVFL